MALKAVIFDIDGTLVNSVDLHADAWRVAFKHFGKVIDGKSIRDQIGKGGDELMPVFLSKEEINSFGDELKEYRGKIFKANYLDKVTAFPGVRDLFERIKQDGKKLALGSSAHKEELEVYVKLMNVVDLVDAETSADDASRAKPHPDIFERVLSKLNVTPDEAIVVGDTPYDAEAAGKAGLKTIGFLCGGFEQKKLLEAGVVALFESPEDLLQKYASSPIAAPVAQLRP